MIFRGKKGGYLKSSRPPVAFSVAAGRVTAFCFGAHQSRPRFRQRRASINLISACAALQPAARVSPPAGRGVRQRPARHPSDDYRRRTLAPPSSWECRYRRMARITRQRIMLATSLRFAVHRAFSSTKRPPRSRARHSPFSVGLIFAF